LKQKVIIASQSPVKIKAVQIAFTKVFPSGKFEYEGISADSNVPDQPMSNDETFKGAKNRCLNAFELKQDADFWVGIEGGIQKVEDELEAFAWVYLKSKNKTGKGRTGSFFLPKRIAELIEQGYELGDADDIVFDLKDSKKNNGAVGILTGNIIDRASYYTEAIILALIPILNEELY
jgi:inosine/xanthosine triphosphatase